MRNIIIFNIIFCFWVLKVYGQDTLYVSAETLTISNSPPITLKLCDSLLQLTSDDSRQSSLYNLKGNIYRKQSKLDSAFLCFKRALALDSANKSAYHGLIAYHNKRTEWQWSLLYYQKIIKQFPNLSHYDINYYHCAIFKILGRLKASLKIKKTYADYLLNNLNIEEYDDEEPDGIQKLLDVHRFFADYYLAEQHIELVDLHKKKQCFYENLLNNKK